MKKLLGLAAGAAALVSTAALAADLSPVYKAAPAVQQQPVSGYVGVYVGADWASYGLTDGDFVGQRETSSAFLLGGEGRLNWWLDPNWAVQLDVEGEGTGGIFRSCVSSLCEREARYAGTVGGHIAYRMPQSYAIGAFAGSTATNLLDFDGGMSYGFGGLEAQAYLGLLTLYGQGGLFGRWAGVKDEQIIDGYFLRGVARYYVTPDDKLSASVEYASGAREDCLGCFFASSGGRQSVVLWTAAYEHRFAGKPLSVFLAYEGMNYQDSIQGSNGRVDESKVMAGARLYVNEGTLLYNDRNGATWDMPKFLKTLSWGDVSAEGGNCFSCFFAF